MATTKIWKVENNLRRIIDYARNTQKTLNPDWDNPEQAALHDVLNYAADCCKTEQRFYVTGVNCLPETALREMQLTKERYGKSGGIQAFHAYQSFAANEVDAETAHRVGVELANRLWGGRFEVIVATHLNTGHFHNHFVLNSVSFLDGKRYCDNKTTYALLRKISDEICHAYGLSVITHPKGKGRQYAEWQAERDGKPTWRTAIREDMDAAVMSSMTWGQFLRAMQERGYQLDFCRKHPRILPSSFDHYARLDNLGENYTPEAIKQRILRQQYRVHPPTPEPRNAKQVKMLGDFRLSKVTWNGLRALYFFYLRKLRQAAKQPAGYAPFILREDLRLLDRLSEQAKFLFRYKVDTKEQLADCKTAIQKRIDLLKAERKELINEKRRVGTSPDRKRELEDLIRSYSKRLKPLYREIKLADSIAERSEAISKNLEMVRTPQKEQPQIRKNKEREDFFYDKSHRTRESKGRCRQDDHRRQSRYRTCKAGKQGAFDRC